MLALAAAPPRAVDNSNRPWFDRRLPATQLELRSSEQGPAEKFRRCISWPRLSNTFVYFRCPSPNSPFSPQ